MVPPLRKAKESLSHESTGHNWQVHISTVFYTHMNKLTNVLRIYKQFHFWLIAISITCLLDNSRSNNIVLNGYSADKLPL